MTEPVDPPVVVTPDIPVPDPKYPPGTPVVFDYNPVKVSIDADDAIGAILTQLEAQASKLLSEAIKEVIPQLVAAVDPLLAKYVAQVEAQVPGWIKSFHLFEKEPHDKESEE